jgi:Domain of unknown function (DUF4352)
MSAPAPGTPARGARRRLLVAAVLALLVLAGAATWFTTRSGTDAAAPATASAVPVGTRPAPAPKTDVPLPSATPTAVPSTVLAAAPGLPAKLPPVALDAASDYGDGVRAHLVGLQTFTAAAQGVGEVAGPALAVTVEITNDGAQALSLDSVAVNLYRGAAGVPASRVLAESASTFSGPLAPGASARAVYAFSVPEADRDVVTVTVGYSAGTATAVFSGPVA